MLSFQYAIIKIIYELFYIFSFCFGNLLDLQLSYISIPSGHIQVLTGHMWLWTVLDSTDLDDVEMPIDLHLFA
jgi:hypothetical protein